MRQLVQRGLRETTLSFRSLTLFLLFKRRLQTSNVTPIQETDFLIPFITLLTWVPDENGKGLSVVPPKEHLTVSLFDHL